MSTELAAGRVFLRRLRQADAPDFHQALGDATAMRLDRRWAGGAARSMAMYGLLAPNWHALHPNQAQSAGATP